MFSCFRKKKKKLKGKPPLASEAAISVKEAPQQATLQVNQIFCTWSRLYILPKNRLLRNGKLYAKKRTYAMMWNNL